MRKDSLRYFLVFLALVMWALSFPAIKFALEEVEPLTLAAIRFIIPLPIIYVYYCMESKSERDTEKMAGASTGEKPENENVYKGADFNGKIKHCIKNYNGGT